MSFQLQYPKTTPSTTVVLPNPKFGDVLRLNTHTLIRTTRGGELKAFRDSDWFENVTTVYSFVDVTTSIRDSFETFLIDYAAKEIAINDQLSRTWYGYIITDVFEIITTRDDGCSYDLSFEFLGVLQ